MLTNRADPDQTPHDVASDLGQHCLLMTLYGFPDKNVLKVVYRLNMLYRPAKEAETNKVIFLWKT